jgi:hypothetical protein
MLHVVFGRSAQRVFSFVPCSLRTVNIPVLGKGFLVLVLLLWPTSITAQEARGAITGVVTDSSGAPIPETQLTAQNTATGVAVRSRTNSSGNYAILYLIPGAYSISVEHAGFERLIRTGIEVRVGDELKLDLPLRVGNVQETIVVKETTPLLQAENADLGETMNQAQLSQLPLADGNPFILMRLGAGAVFTGSPQFTRPFDNGDVSAIRVNGSEGSNEFTLNGLPNTGKQLHFGANVVAFIPPSDAIQEFKMTTSTFSALSGHTASSTINVSTKSGTNSLHGTAYDFFRNDILSANDFFSNRAGQPRQIVRYNRFGGSIGGPVFLPNYDGRNKTFFFFAYENLPDAFPEHGTFTVPTAGERQGDFSALRPLGNIIYDPLTAEPIAGPGGHVQRQPFPNNVIPANRLSPIALNVMKFYPLPNQSGRTDGTNNYYSPQPRTDRFHSETGRIDHSVSSRQRLSGTYFANWREELRFDWAPSVDGIQATGQNTLLINHGGTLEDVFTLSPTTVLNLRAGFIRLRSQIVPPNVGFDPIQLGFSPAVTLLFTGPSYLPAFSISGYSQLSHNTGTNIYQTEASNTYTFVPTITTIKRNHTLNFGYEFRVYRENMSSPGNSSGFYQFKQDFTKATDSSATQMGQGLASFLLGQPTGGSGGSSIDRTDSRANQAVYHASFFQDDWKVWRKLTLNLGLRYELETPTTERYNRNVRGFDLTDPNPIAEAATTAFAKAYPDGVLVEPNQPPITSNTLRVLGGPIFVSKPHRGFWNPDARNFQPRLGFAYQLTERTVVRGGWAIYSVPFQISGVNQAGFSQTTALVPTNDNGLTFQANLAHPFPNGVLNPTGSSSGLATALGQNIATFMPPSPKTGHSDRWAFDIQRELPRQWVIDASYVGSRGYDLARDSKYLNATPPQYLSTSLVRDDVLIGQLSAQVINPFLGLAPGSSLNTNKTINAQQLVTPFPHFGSITTSLYNGTNSYHAGQLRVEHRFSQGFAVGVAYTWSKLLERYGFLNDFQTEPTKQISGNDIPQRVTITFICQLPFGKGRRWGTKENGFVNMALGGWQAQGIFQVQSGEPLDWSKNDVAYFGNPSILSTNINGNTLTQIFGNTAIFYPDTVAAQNPQSDTRIHLQDNIRTFPLHLSNVRGQGQNNWDLSAMKTFFVTERAILQFRAEFLNAFNHVWFDNPSTSSGMDPRNAGFGQITDQRNLPREIQLALKLVF